MLSLLHFPFFYILFVLVIAVSVYSVTSCHVNDFIELQYLLLSRCDFFQHASW